jgi:osmotically-inducible protein OsmY
MAGLLKMAAVGIGTALIAFLFDPDRGRGRRAQLRDQAKSQLRKAQEAARQQAEFRANRFKGLTHQFRSGDGSADLEDDLIRQKVKSEVIGPAAVSNIEVDVRNGVVTLSGDLDDEQYRHLMKEIQKVSGVQSVDLSQATST